MARSFPAALLCQPVQTLGCSEWTEDLLGRLALAARRLARPLGCECRRLACGVARERPGEMTASGQCDRERIVGVEPGIAVRALVALGKSRFHLGDRAQVEQPPVLARLQ